MVDSIMPALLKKAADTNVFIQESADRALIQCCMNCSEVKALNCLQAQSNIKSSTMKVKLAMCYNALIEKLGLKIKQFRDQDRLLNALASLLSEGAIEVRNMAKLGFLTLKSSFGGPGRELDSLLRKCIQNDKVYEKVK
mmetsp:Transcript_41099/g.30230  ORF Transcript_41099/g.30230 Transcript_41099/m.30230 type:complete len:139 (+) Transcript_41099:1897-2313(+)